MQVRKLNETDYDEILTQWWKDWPNWSAPPKEFLPNNGTGGLMVEKEGEPIVACFLYFTNSKAVLLEWLVSSPTYREDNRQEAIELLINSAEELCKKAGNKFMFSIGRNKHLIETHKKLGWHVDDTPSHEIVKTI